MRKLSLNLVISAISVISIFLLLELFARFLNPILRISHGHISLGIGGQDILEYPSGYIKDRELFWRLDPFCEEYNSVGLRDNEFSLYKEENVFRIICMGDSVTFGWPSKLKHTYPKELEKLLSLQFPEKKFEVINAGIPGYSSYQGKILLERNLIKYKPNLIIVYYGINDRDGSYKPDKEQKKLPVWVIKIVNYLRKFQFYKLFNKVILYLKYPPENEVIYSMQRVSPQNYKDNLKSIMKMAESNGSKTLFIVSPVFYNPEKKFIFTDTRYTPPENISQFDIYSFFKIKEDGASELFLDDMRPFNFHLTDKGHRLLAEEIFKYYFDKGL